MWPRNPAKLGLTKCGSFSKNCFSRASRIEGCWLSGTILNLHLGCLNWGLQLQGMQKLFLIQDFELDSWFQTWCGTLGFKGWSTNLLKWLPELRVVDLFLFSASWPSSPSSSSFFSSLLFSPLLLYLSILFARVVEWELKLCDHILWLQHLRDNFPFAICVGNIAFDFCCCVSLELT